MRLETPTLRDHTLDQIAQWWRVVPCPACRAPAGAPCADRRSYDKDLYGVRTHRERRTACKLHHASE